MLQFITKVMPGSALDRPPFDNLLKANNFKNECNGQMPSFTGYSSGFSKVDSDSPINYASSSMSVPSTANGRSTKISSQNGDNSEVEPRDSNSDCGTKSPSEDLDSDGFGERISSSQEGGPASNLTSAQTPTEDFARDTQLQGYSNSPNDVHFLKSESVSAVDVIYLWEHGTDEMLPIRMWDEAQLSRGGEVIKSWHQIITLFKEGCGGNLEMFVDKYSNADGKLMSVSDILAVSQKLIVGNGVYKAGSEITQSSPIASNNNNLERTSPSRSTLNAAMTQFPANVFKAEPGTPLYTLPRKINGQKVSAKDVIRIWEEGFGSIPPVKLWIPNQKLKQQSKISRWKKIVDIFKSECNGNMKMFEHRYSNECGILLPIAAIITKYEQCQPGIDSMKQPTMSNINQSVFNVSQTTVNVRQPSAMKNEFPREDADRYWGSYKRLYELGKEWDYKKAQSCSDRRAFTIRQVENWQRNSIQSSADRRHKSLSSLSEGQREVRTSINGRHDSTRSCPDQQQLHKKNNAKIPEAASSSVIRVNASDSTINNKSGALSRQSNDFDNKNSTVSLKGYNAVRGVDLGVPQKNHLHTMEDLDESSPVPESENSDTSSNRDIDITGTESSVSVAPSECYGLPNDYVDSNEDKLEKAHYSMSSISGISQSQRSRQSSTNSSEIPREEPKSVIMFERDGCDATTSSTATNVRNSSCTVLPESDDPFEVIKLWETGSENCPPIRFLDVNDDEMRHSRLVAWRKFIDIFNYHCNSDKQILAQKYSDEQGRLLRVSEILHLFEATHLLHPLEPQRSPIQDSLPATRPAVPYKPNPPMLDMNRANPDTNVYILPRKINGHKVSARDVIHIWHHGLKHVPPVGTWLPQQKVRQQSKISRWKKIVEIFEVDCNGDMQRFEAKYSSKMGDLLPIAAIISKYEAEKSTLDSGMCVNIKVDNLHQTY